MNDTARIYRAEILRAVLGPGAPPSKAVDLERLNQFARHLADCEQAQAILRAKGHGAVGMTFVEIARGVPENVRGLLRGLFRRSGADLVSDRPNDTYAGSGEVHDIWSAR